MGRKKEFTGIWIPREIWEDERLGIHDKVVYAVISGLAKGESGCYATNKALAEFCRCSERTVCASVAALTSAGHILVEGGNSKTRQIYLPGTSQNLRDNLAKSANQPRKNCEVTSQNLRGDDENLPIVLNYNNIYKNNHNNKPENKPNMEEIRGYIAEQKAAVDPVVFYEYYDAGNWRDKKGNPINWRQKVLLWAVDANKKREQEKDVVPVAGSFETCDFFAASLAAAESDDTADENLPWVGG